MLGHAGISTYEYYERADEEDEEVKQEWKKKWSTVKLRKKKDQSLEEASEQPMDSTSEEVELTALNTDTTDLEVTLPALEVNSPQRRRGTFVNHTPRSFEFHSQNRAETQQHPYESFSRPNTSYQGSSDANARTSSAHRKTASVDSCYDKSNLGTDPNAPIELDSRGICRRISVEITRSPSSPGCKGDGPTISAAGASTMASIPSMREAHKTRKSRAVTQELSALRRRQEERGSAVEEGESKSSMDTGEKSTYRAIKEYFNNVPVWPDTGTMGRLKNPLPKDKHFLPREIRPLPREMRRPRSSRSGYSQSNRSLLSVHSDFVSTALGIYSPFDSDYEYDSDDYPDPQFSPPPMHNSFERISVEHASLERVDEEDEPPMPVRIAPPVPTHEEMTTNTLNDLNFFLRNTGPPETAVPKKKKSTFEALKIGSTKKMDGPVGEDRPRIPDCTRIRTTPGGRKYYQIIIPTDELAEDQTVNVPVAVLGANGGSRRFSITWTDEMVNPLASPAVEKAIAGYSGADISSSGGGGARIGNPRSPPVSPKAIRVQEHPLAEHPLEYRPVEDHPLHDSQKMSREEQTRLRKLRDLMKIKSKVNNTASSMQDTTAGALPPSEEPCHKSCRESMQELADQAETQQGRADALQQATSSLGSQNAALAAALADVLGVHESTDPEHLLELCRQLKVSMAE